MKYFKMGEFRCRWCSGLPPDAQENIRALVEAVLDPARERYGGPVTVNSGYRCAKHNREVGGVSASQHLRGEAADVMCADNRRLAKIIAELGKFDQMILYPSFVHVSWKRQGTNRKQVLRKTAKGYERVDLSTL